MAGHDVAAVWLLVLIMLISEHFLGGGDNKKSILGGLLSEAPDFGGLVKLHIWVELPLTS